MNTLKAIFLTIVELIKQAWLLPRTISDAMKARRERADLNEREAERLVRIRCPSKYLGKGG